MLHPYYLLSSTTHNQRLKALFCSRFLLYNTRWWSVHIWAVLCILIISNLGLSLWETMLQPKKKKDFSCATFPCQEVKGFSSGAVLLLLGFMIFLLSEAHILLQCRVWSLILYTLIYANKHKTMCWSSPFVFMWPCCRQSTGTFPLPPAFLNLLLSSLTVLRYIRT